MTEDQSLMEDQSFELMPYFMWTVKDVPSTLSSKSPIFTVADVKFSLRFQQYDNLSALIMIPEVEDEQSTVPSYDNTTSVSIMIPGKSLEDFLYIQKSTLRNHTGRKVSHIVWEKEARFLENSGICRGVNEQNDVTFMCVFGPLCHYQKDEQDFENPWCEFLCMEKLGNDLNEMRLKEDPSFVLKCGDKTLPIHEVILSARSKLFAEMILKKNVTKKEIQIENMEFEVLENFITYIYSGRLKNGRPSVQLLTELYKNAEEYKFEALKAMASCKLIQILEEGKLSGDPEILEEEKLPSDPKVSENGKLPSDPKVSENGKLSSDPKVLENGKLSSDPKVSEKGELLLSDPEILNEEELTSFSLQVLDIANHFKDETFRNSVILSIVRNNAFIMNEKEWKEFRENNESLAKEVYDAYFNDRYA